MKTNRLFSMYLLLFISVLNINSQEAVSQQTNYSFRIHSGLGFLSLAKWEDAYKDVADISTDNPDLSYGFGVSYTVLDCHSINFNVSFTDIFGTAKYKERRLPEQYSIISDRVEWEFRMIPVSVSYEYRTYYSKWGIYPTIEGGTSVYYVDIRVKDYVEENFEYLGNRWLGDSRIFGFFGAAGGVKDLNPVFSVYAKAMYRYCGDMRLSGEEIRTPDTYNDFDEIVIGFSGYEFFAGFIVRF